MSAYMQRMIRKFTTAVTCLLENKRLVVRERSEFAFKLSQVSGPQREHSSYVMCMRGSLRVTTFRCFVFLTCVFVASIL
jgi:hypothetical protein